jgi:hypothetical protein
LGLAQWTFIFTAGIKPFLDTYRVEEFFTGSAFKLWQLLGSSMDDEVADWTFVYSLELAVYVALPHQKSTQQSIVVSRKQLFYTQHPLRQLFVVNFDLLVHGYINQAKIRFKAVKLTVTGKFQGN